MQAIRANTTEETIVRASGVCSTCDSRFRDELVLRIPESCVPGGYIYIELRHLHEAARTGPPDRKLARPPR